MALNAMRTVDVDDDLVALIAEIEGERPFDEDLSVPGLLGLPD